MEWWNKLRKAFLAVTVRLKARKSANGKRSNSSSGRFEASDNHESEKGLLSLRDDIETCEYHDVHVLWSILSQMQEQQAELAPQQSPPQIKKQGKHSWRAFFWCNNHFEKIDKS